MRRRIPFLVVAVATLFAMTAGSALATVPGTLDAEQTGTSISLLPLPMLAQTFVPTITGTLGTVEINTFTESSPNTGASPNNPPVMTVEITTTSGGLPTSTVLASETTSPLDDDWNIVTLSAPPSVVAGTKYAIVVTQDPSGLGIWNGACSDPYGPGEGLVFNSTWLTIADAFPRGTCMTDFAFQTYIMTPPPPPAATPPPTSTAGNNSGVPKGNPSYLLIFAGLASAAVFISISRRRLNQR